MLKLSSILTFEFFLFLFFRTDHIEYGILAAVFDTCANAVSSRKPRKIKQKRAWYRLETFLQQHSPNFVKSAREYFLRQDLVARNSGYTRRDNPCQLTIITASCKVCVSLPNEKRDISFVLSTHRCVWSRISDSVTTADLRDLRRDV